MGYILTSAASPDAGLIEACAGYIGGEDGGGLMQAISGLTAMTPAGWRALAEAADHAFENGENGHAAELIFVMQRSLLGKRKRMREQPPRIVEPANVNETPVAKIALNAPHDGGMNALATADIVDSWCTGMLTTDTLPGLAAKIRARQEMAQGIVGDWKPAAAYLNAMANMTAADADRLFATA